MGAGCCICCMLLFYLVASLAISRLLQPVKLFGKVCDSTRNNQQPGLACGILSMTAHQDLSGTITKAAL